MNYIPYTMNTMPCVCTLNPTPLVTNRKLYTLNLKPETLDIKA